MQMEERQKPVVQVLNDKPPSEPPPSQEHYSKPKTPHIEELQRIDDITYTAATLLNEIDSHHATLLCDKEYTPHIKKLTSNAEVNAQLLQQKRDEYSRRQKKSKKKSMPPPRPHPLHIPTIKSSNNTKIPHLSTIHNTSWKDDETRKWKESSTTS